MGKAIFISLFSFYLYGQVTWARVRQFFVKDPTTVGILLSNQKLHKYFRSSHESMSSSDYVTLRRNVPSEEHRFGVSEDEDSTAKGARFSWLCTVFVHLERCFRDF